MEASKTRMNSKREQLRPKKGMDPYQRQVRRNQILLIVLSVVLILSMLISALVQF